MSSRQRKVTLGDDSWSRLEALAEAEGADAQELVRRAVWMYLERSRAFEGPSRGPLEGPAKVPHGELVPSPAKDGALEGPSTGPLEGPAKAHNAPEAETETSPARTRADRNFLVGDTEAQSREIPALAFDPQGLLLGGGEGSGGEAPLLSFSTKGPTLFWHLTARKLDEYRASFPGVDVLQVLREARQWLLDNPGRRKTAGGMPRYLGSWIARAVNSGKAPLLPEPRSASTSERSRNLLTLNRAKAELFARRRAGEITETELEHELTKLGPNP